MQIAVQKKTNLQLYRFFLHKFALNAYVFFGIWDVTSPLTLTQALVVLVVTL